ncbi:MAG: Asp-tRNA(Asn)/Glu-tRNA(Gln) amidotransferase subunit GatB, partial [Verrucomicrobiota bacterium]|nr:Asp-tRNA(Asn)/Glu-tRNA(Gln) amidotransferase subunit GatB [Verrucomicrobiota bacterium]
CNCSIQKFNKFDRKNYFYPDQTKNYQISQFDLPICLGGHLDVEGTGFSGNPLPPKRIGITRIHMEEDPAKLTHFNDSTGVDYNRAGVPLLEVVSEPDMRTADEAYAYLTGLKQIMQYAGVSDCDMEKGQMRCDINISLREDESKPFGIKLEVKNLNSFSAAHKAIGYEYRRQARMLDNGKKLEQQTLRWDDDRGRTIVLRTKEEANDYRYFPEPDLPPIVFSDEELQKIKKSLPEGPAEKKEKYLQNYKLPEYDVDILTADKNLANYFEQTVQLGAPPKPLSNFIMSELLRELSNKKIKISECPVKPPAMAELFLFQKKKIINAKIAKKVFEEMFESGKSAKAIIKEKGLEQVTDSGEIETFIDIAIKENPTQVEQYKNGETKVINFFVGQVMKLSRGKANPPMVITSLKEKLKG